MSQRKPSEASAKRQPSPAGSALRNRAQFKLKHKKPRSQPMKQQQEPCLKANLAKQTPAIPAGSPSRHERRNKRGKDRR